MSKEAKRTSIMTSPTITPVFPRRVGITPAFCAAPPSTSDCTSAPLSTPSLSAMDGPAICAQRCVSVCACACRERTGISMHHTLEVLGNCAVSTGPVGTANVQHNLSWRTTPLLETLFFNHSMRLHPLSCNSNRLLLSHQQPQRSACHLAVADELRHGAKHSVSWYSKAHAHTGACAWMDKALRMRSLFFSFCGVFAFCRQRG